MKNSEADKIIESLSLSKHPEGGWYTETYRSTVNVELDQGQRSLATVIYFLLKSEEFSAFHRLKSDEFWYFHQGSPLEISVIGTDGLFSTFTLGPAGEKSVKPQLLLPAGCWFAAKCLEKSSYSLVSCSVHPGFDFKDFEMAERALLLKKYPQYRSVIEKLCPE